jgi:nitroreductase
MSTTMPVRNLAEQLILSRRSVRAFRPDPVPRDELEAILTVASRAPSNANMQPWLVEVVAGATRDRLSAALVSAMTEGRYSIDFHNDEQMYADIHSQRREAMGERLYDALGIARDDLEARNEWYLDNLRFFGAPHALFLFMPPKANERMANDVGMYGQTLMLAMAARGVSSCPQAILGFFADTVREMLGITEGNRLLFGISFGYADDSSPVNNVDMPRVPLSENTRWYDYPSTVGALGELGRPDERTIERVPHTDVGDGFEQ